MKCPTKLAGAKFRGWVSQAPPPSGSSCGLYDLELHDRNLYISTNKPFVVSNSIQV